MNKYVKKFLHRGLIFGGFGPIIAGIVFFAISMSIPDFAVSGGQMLAAVISTYLLAFVQAGASVFNQIEGWSPARSLSVHMPTIYAAYVLCYLVNFWIPFEWGVIFIFTAVFAASYIVIWLTVFFCVSASSKRLNSKLK